MAVITIRRDHLVALLGAHLQADDHRLLPNIEMAEPSNEAHAVELPGFLLKPPDQQHFAIGGEFFILGECGWCGGNGVVGHGDSDIGSMNGRRRALPRTIRHSQTPPAWAGPVVRKVHEGCSVCQSL